MRTQPARVLLAVTLSMLVASAASGIPAFPGAEGFGSETAGGRGGAVLFVTNLNDSGPGSLRAALQATGPRTVIFRTGGTITLSNPIVISSPYVTVAGQTAPGGGIQIRHNPDGYANARAGLSADSFTSIEINTHDVVLRYLRIRPGPLNPNELCGELNDPDVPVPPGIPPTAGRCVDQGDIQSIAINPAAYNVVLDHCSMYWGSDEVIDISGATDVTIQWSIVAEGMNYVLYDGYFYGVPPVSGHAKGIITGDTFTAGTLGEITGRMSLHHNLWAHHNGRAPQMGAHCPDPGQPEACFSDVVNNVTYNWEKYGADAHNVLGNHFSNFIGNMFKSGPDSPVWNPGNPFSFYNGFTMHDWTDSVYALLPRNFDVGIYFADNKRPLAGGGSTDVPINCVRWSTALNAWQLCDALLDYGMPVAFATPAVTTTLADDAYIAVLADAGANRGLDAAGYWVAARDDTDTRVSGEVQSGGGSLIQDLDDFVTRGGWPTLAEGSAPADTDADGMPDAFEDAPGACLDPGVADAGGDADGDGYTNLEEYLNGTPASPDGDGDGVADACDNCPTVANASQSDGDSDGIGDACECAAGNTGLRNATAQGADSGGDNNGFEQNATSAFSDGGNYARNNNGPGDQHRYYNYGVTIPPFCSVKGIEVRLDWWLDGTSGTNSMSAELSWDGGASWSAAKTDSTETTSQHTFTLGSASDTWGRAWTAAELSNGSFRVRVRSNGTTSSRDYRLDWIPVRVTYAQ